MLMSPAVARHAARRPAAAAPPRGLTTATRGSGAGEVRAGPPPGTAGGGGSSARRRLPDGARRMAAPMAVPSVVPERVADLASGPAPAVVPRPGTSVRRAPDGAPAPLRSTSSQPSSTRSASSSPACAVLLLAPGGLAGVRLRPGAPWGWRWRRRAAPAAPSAGARLQRVHLVAVVGELAPRGAQGLALLLLQARRCCCSQGLDEGPALLLEAQLLLAQLALLEGQGDQALAQGEALGGGSVAPPAARSQGHDLPLQAQALHRGPVAGQGVLHALQLGGLLEQASWRSRGWIWSS